MVLYKSRGLSTDVLCCKCTACYSPLMSSMPIRGARCAWLLRRPCITARGAAWSPSGQQRSQPMSNTSHSAVHGGMTGRCQCGEVKFTTPTPSPLGLYVCHCTECRHQSSSAFGITALFPFFEIPGHDAARSPAPIGTFTRYTARGRYMECLFCRTCGCRLVHRFRDQIPGHKEYIDRQGVIPTVSVKAGCLDGLTREALNEAVHIWCQSAIVPIPKGVVSWPGRPEGGTTIRR